MSPGFRRNKILIRCGCPLVFIFLFCSCINTHDNTLIIYEGMRHIRNSDISEWSTFPALAERELILDFEAADGMGRTLGLRQLDVKQTWQVIVNEKDIGSLIADEKNTAILLPIPAGLIAKGKNTLRISTSSASADDIMVGDIKIFNDSVGQLLSASSVDLNVLDGESGSALPARITVLDKFRSMAPVMALSDESRVALRNGCVYTSTGKARLGLAPGNYTVFVTRGFEYGVDSTKLQVHEGQQLSRTFRISREVDTKGWIASDTHVHTMTHSGHGDATDRERVITLAGEGIELPIITDHNVHINLSDVALSTRVGQWFTPVVGNEVTTNVGHFNVFPVPPDIKPIDPNVENWNSLTNKLKAYPAGLIILNHADDIHKGFRPFDASRQISIAGARVDDWKCPANAMEVLNSGSTQTDIMKLYQHWFGMLNGGNVLTPIGSSDSHDVCRYIVGQGRTYVKGNDDNPSHIDVEGVVRNFRDGKVLVSAGLMTKLVVNRDYGPGDLVPGVGTFDVDVTVTGPSWARGNRVVLFMNGRPVRQDTIIGGSNVIKWSGRWTFDQPLHDVYLVAVATGPGVRLPFWPIEKPYQPQSPDFTATLIGSSGAVWIDADGNGIRNTANDYARTILSRAKGNIRNTVPLLVNYDEAVACQVAAIWWKAGGDIASPEFDYVMHLPETASSRGFREFRQEVINIAR